MMVKSSMRNLFDLMAGDRMATVMGYLSDVPAGRNVGMATVMGDLSDVAAGRIDRMCYGIPLRCSSRKD